jgi:hypothetical protein
MMVSYSLRNPKHIILWEYFVDMDQQAFLEAQTNMSQEEKEKDDKPKKISIHNPSKKPKKKKEKGRIRRQGGR